MSTEYKSHLFYQTRRRKPMLDEARGIYMWDIDGKRYIDGSSGAMVCNIGHSNEVVLAAMRRQMEKATFGYRLHFETEASEKLAAKTAALMPEGLDRIFFVSGGSEAVESAIKLARQHAVSTGQGSRWKVISRDPSYHGSTLGALALTGYDPLTEPFLPMMRSMPKIPAPRAYLDDLDPDDEATGLHYANMLEAKIREEGPETVLAFIVEPVGGASTGALVPPKGYMERIQEICRQHGRLIDPVLESGGFQHGYTYAGNPLACAAGLAVIEEIEHQGMVANAERMGHLLKARLQDLMQRHAFIGDVRGKGLLLAFEFVADRHTMAPLPPALAAHDRFVNIAYDNGLIVYSRRTRGGLEGDHILVCPPLIIDETQIDEIAGLLELSLRQFTDDIHAALPRSV